MDTERQESEARNARVLRLLSSRFAGRNTPDDNFLGEGNDEWELVPN
jgi:hypothetical protein